MKRVREYGGRFLEMGADGLWYEMHCESACRKKASQGKVKFNSYICFLRIVRNFLSDFFIRVDIIVLREEKWD